MKRHLLILSLAGFSLTGQAHADSACPPGFAMLQASDTCVRISGRVRADALVTSTRIRSSDSLQTQTSGKVRLDVRKQTEYGPLRGVISVEGLHQ
jgi:hypothetical protein